MSLSPMLSSAAVNIWVVHNGPLPFAACISPTDSITIRVSPVGSSKSLISFSEKKKKKKAGEEKKLLSLRISFFKASTTCVSVSFSSSRSGMLTPFFVFSFLLYASAAVSQEGQLFCRPSRFCFLQPRSHTANHASL